MAAAGGAAASATATAAAAAAPAEKKAAEAKAAESSRPVHETEDQRKMGAFCMGRHKRLGEKSRVKALPDDVLRKIFSFLGSWDATLAAWNMNFSSQDMVVDINGGHRGTCVANVSFRKGIHYWEVTVADMRTLCVGVCEKPKNPRALCDKWLGEVGYAISVTSCSGGTAFLWSKEQLSTTTVKGFNPRERVGLVLDMEERTLDYFVEGKWVALAFNRLPPGPMFPACSNGFDKTFCRHVKIDMQGSVPREFFKVKEQRKIEQAKKDAMPPAKPGAGAGGVGTAADLMRTAAPNSAAAAMLAQQPSVPQKK